MGLMKSLTAVLIDTVSNQEYIFSGNRLKENLGGSHLLKTAYEEPLKAALDKVAPGNKDIIDWLDWPKRGDTVMLIGGAEVGYIGGGNALLFFDSFEPRAKSFIHEFSRSILQSRPGLKVAFGILESFDLDKFSDSMKDLHQNLQSAKNRAFPRTLPPRYGITATCPYSGEAIEFERKDKANGQTISAVSYSRLEAVQASTDVLTNKVKERTQLEDLSFTDDHGRLGQTDTRSYVAVVHIDGNGMGKRFKDCKSIGGLRSLSAGVSRATDKAFGLLVKDAVKVVKYWLSANEGFHFKNENENSILPLRPVIIGGDDITFVCEGRLGLFFAERFLLHIGKTSEEEGHPFTACAGVAIVKSKYPFYKAYHYAHDLCSAAKSRSRKEDNGAYLDFLISSGGFSGSIEQIRKRHFTTADGSRSLHYGPYRCDKEKNSHSTRYLRKGISIFQDSQKWSHSHAMKLRDLLSGDVNSCQNFISANRLKLPGITEEGDPVSLFQEENPFFDMLDTMDFYPSELLPEVEK